MSLEDEEDSGCLPSSSCSCCGLCVCACTPSDRHSRAAVRTTESQNDYLHSFQCAASTAINTVVGFCCCVAALRLRFNALSLTAVVLCCAVL